MLWRIESTPANTLKQLRGVRVRRCEHEAHLSAHYEDEDECEAGPNVEGKRFWGSAISDERIGWIGAAIAAVDEFRWLKHQCIPKGDRTVLETVVNVATSMPFVLVGLQTPRERLACRMYGNSIIGVGIASSLYHSSRGDMRKILRFCDYAMIATSTLCVFGPPLREAQPAGARDGLRSHDPLPASAGDRRAHGLDGGPLRREVPCESQAAQGAQPAHHVDHAGRGVVRGQPRLHRHALRARRLAPGRGGERGHPGLHAARVPTVTAAPNPFRFLVTTRGRAGGGGGATEASHPPRGNGNWKTRAGGGGTEALAFTFA